MAFSRQQLSSTAIEGMMNAYHGDWSLDRINKLIADKICESIHLDYKDSRALQKGNQSKLDLSKDVSSFANSDGGVIVYGVGEKEHLPTSIDEGSPINDIDKEWLENVIGSTIQRKITGIRIYPIQVASGRFLYVISIPKSHHAPHMASDNRYYKRYNFKSCPMEEYEVRDVAGRSLGPLLIPDIKMHKRSSIGTQSIYEIDIHISNQNDVIAEHCFISLTLENHLSVLLRSDDFSLTSNDGLHILHHVNSGPNRIPIWKGIERTYKSALRVRVPPKASGMDIIICSISAPLMPEVQYLFQLLHSQDGLSVVRVEDEVFSALKKNQKGKGNRG